MAHKSPCCYKFVQILQLAFIHSIVVISFAVFLILLGLIQCDLINAVSQGIVLTMLCICLANGINSLIRYWKILTYWQAIVLLAQVSF